jgi:hypothetical protein
MKKEVVVFNPLTGEKLNPDLITPELASEILKPILMRKKQFEEIEKVLKEKLGSKIDWAINNGEKKIFNYWNVQRGKMTFDKKRFEEDGSIDEQHEYGVAQDTIKAIESKYLKVGKPFIKFPKL